MTLMLADLHTMKVGTVLQKGKRKRIFLGVKGMFAYYRTPSSKSITGENLTIFRKWLLDAKVVEN
ncbi:MULTISPECIES: hypothetical protein [Bacillus]|uniref:hypothetical protein n=1 Tax=Bacillus TaxID=1386 RepID=UPI000B5DB175|nr:MULTISPECIES: hypothetical protein [Bacillus]MBH0323347.1 hypothetical protein [Bacillus cereus]OXB99578.1 hypothetical protein CGQ22_08160 [Bacillus sp. M13(2017)]QCY61491.1 hypothetical protein FHE73_12075 [Bacillus thuringiensis]